MSWSVGKRKGFSMKPCPTAVGKYPTRILLIGDRENISSGWPGDVCFWEILPG